MYILFNLLLHDVQLFCNLRCKLRALGKLKVATRSKRDKNFNKSNEIGVLDLEDRYPAGCEEVYQKSKKVIRSHLNGMLVLCRPKRVCQN